MDRVARELERAVSGGTIPSASVVVRVGGRVELLHTCGVARFEPRREVVPDEAYDLASLTKPVAAVVLAGMFEDAVVSPADPVARWLPDTDPRITVAHLLTHTSGLPAWAPLVDRGTSDRAALLRIARSVPLAHAPGLVHTYSDLGFLALLALVETIGGARLDVLLAPWLSRAGVDLRWGWPGAAATEGHVVEGTVHDPNAAVLDGVSAHAGLFGTARSVADFGEAVLDPDSGLPVRGIRAGWAIGGTGSHRGGWDTPTPGGSTGEHWPADTVGHLGFTGTSLWIAPRDRVVVALLTNRVHPTDGDRAPIRALRRAVHEAVATSLGWDREPRCARSPE